MRFTSATYSAPSLSATPFGILRPEAIVMTCVAFASRKRTAYTRSARVPTKSTLPLPSASERASGTSSAKTPISKPGGSLMRSSGRRWAGAACARTNATHAHPARTALPGRFPFTARPVKIPSREIVIVTNVSASAENDQDGLWGDTLHRPPLFQHHPSARSVAALDLLRVSGALFHVTPERAD